MCPRPKLPTEVKQRAAIVAEAESWLRTPYHHQAAVKGAGVDCAMLLVEVYHACGLIPRIDPRPYPPDWHLHRDEEKYLGWVREYTHVTADPLPGDLALYKFGRVVSHGVIVVRWPLVIHAYMGEGCRLADASHEPLASRFVSAYELNGLGEK